MYNSPPTGSRPSWEPTKTGVLQLVDHENDNTITTTGGQQGKTLLDSLWNMLPQQLQGKVTELQITSPQVVGFAFSMRCHGTELLQHEKKEGIFKQQGLGMWTLWKKSTLSGLLQLSLCVCYSIGSSISSWCQGSVDIKIL